MDLLYVLVLGAVVGWIAGRLTRGEGFGLLKNILVGIAGAVVGRFVGPAVGLESGGLVRNLVQATVGALIFLLVLGFFTGKRKRKKRKA